MVRQTYMEIATDDEKWDWECDVRIADGEIVVSYDDGGAVIYRGKEIEPGYYRLVCSDRAGTATLHRAPGGLEGSWIEEGYRGWWKIPLED